MATKPTAGPRVACIDLPAFPLQLLLRDRPSCRGGPAGVVDQDRPEGRLLYLNRGARRQGLLPGMRYGAARNLVPGLEAGVISAGVVQAAVDELCRALQTFSPRVESATDGAAARWYAPGVFFVDPRGLARLYGGPVGWTQTVQQYLKGRGFVGATVAAFTRFGAFAIARSQRGPRVVAQREEERARLAQVPLAVLEVPAALRDGLDLLGVRTVGDLLALPMGELHARFGPEASALYALAMDDPQLPMQPRRFDEPARVAFEVDPPDTDLTRLLFAIKGALHELLRVVAGRGEALTALQLSLELERAAPVHERLEPATPSREVATLVELLRLRLEGLELASPVVGVELRAETLRAEGHQLPLFAGQARRDLEAGERALARLRAAFGAGAVTRARLRDAHLPEARFVFEPTTRLILPRPETVADAPPASPPPLMRRLFARPRPLSRAQVASPIAGLRLERGGRVERLYGPYRLSGGWWVRAVERDYYYAETASGDLLWLYYDRPRQRWFWQGQLD